MKTIKSFLRLVFLPVMLLTAGLSYLVIKVADSLRESDPNTKTIEDALWGADSSQSKDDLPTG